MSIRSLASSLPRQALGAAQGVAGLVRDRLPGAAPEPPAAPAPPQPAASAPKPVAPAAKKPVAPAPKPVKPKPLKAKAKPAQEKAKPAKPKAAKAKPKAPKAKASKPKAAKAAAAAEAKPVKPGPHHELNNPVVDNPDPTEWPDPYDQREDPRGPENGAGIPGATSTSEPHPAEELEPDDRRAKAKRDKLDQ